MFWRLTDNYIGRTVVIMLQINAPLLDICLLLQSTNGIVFAPLKYLLLGSEIKLIPLRTVMYFGLKHLNVLESIMLAVITNKPKCAVEQSWYVYSSLV